MTCSISRGAGRRLSGVGPLERFHRDRDGSVFITFGILVMAMVVAVGCAIDIYEAKFYETRLQSALDSGVLAGSIVAEQGNDPTATIKTYVAENFEKQTNLTATVTSSVDRTAAVVKANGSITVPTSFMKLIGFSTLGVSVDTAATYGGKDVELVIALDTTGSMSGAKMTAAKSAAKSLIDTVSVIPGTTTQNTHVKIGLVPFTDYVNIGTKYRGSSWLSVPNDSSTTTNQCWTEYPNAVYSGPYTVTGTCYDDGRAYSCSWTEYQNVNLGAPATVCGPVTTTTEWYGCVGSRAWPQDQQETATSSAPVPGLMDQWCPAPVTRLTTDMAALRTAIGDMWEGGETYIAPGLLWAWRLLSPTTPFADGAAYGGTTDKYIILMTDGANTHSPDYPYHWDSNVATANDILSKTCEQVKAKGINIFTIAFQVSDATVKSILTKCASASTNYYDSGTITDMKNAFQSIADKLSKRRLVY